MTERLYVFLTSRPCDRGEVWPLVFTDRERAEQAPHRVSEVVAVSVPMLEPKENHERGYN